uniref:Uncharacterized protein n=1 Tax=Arundo donax TaxID=35708 RepID=A0A0A8Z2L0_ARUDO
MWSVPGVLSRNWA